MDVERPAEVGQLSAPSRLRRLLPIIVVLLTAILVAALYFAGTYEYDGSVPQNRGGTEPSASQASAPGGPVDVAHPFTRTPAADWADGAAGIVAPPAVAVGGFTAEQVAAATERTRQALVASRIEPAMVVAHRPDAYLSQLAPDAAEQLTPLFAPGQETQVQALVSLVSDRHTLLPVPPKVSGRMWVEPGDVDELVVHTSYVFSYAFAVSDVSSLADVMDMVVVVRADVDYVQRFGPRWSEGSQGLWYDHADGYGYSIGCAEYRLGFLAPALNERVATEQTTRPDRSTYFDPNAPVAAQNGCTV